MVKRNYEAEIEQRVDWIKKLMADSGARGIVLGISGGIDSAVVAVLCQKAAGDNFLGLIMPIESNPVHQRDALELINKFGMKYKEIDLTGSFAGLADSIGEAYGEELSALSRGNMKARLRMITDYAIANQLGYLVAGTDNLSETVTGYFTKYGDGAVDFLPISDLLKREVYEMAECLGIPEAIMTKAPSADLWQGQTDEEEMGITYDEIESYIKKDLPPESRAYQKIDRLYRSSEHKRNLPAAYK